MTYSGKAFMLIDSGVILMPKNRMDSNTRLIKVSEDFSFNLQISVSQGERNDLSTALNDSTVSVRCTLGKGSKAGGNREILEIGSYKEKQIYLNFWASYLGDDHNMLQTVYSVHMEV